MTRFWPQLWQALTRDAYADALADARFRADELSRLLAERTAERDRARDTAVTLHADTVRLETELAAAAERERNLHAVIREHHATNARLLARNAAANRIITGLLADDNPTVARAIADGEVWLQSGVTA